MNVIKFFLIIGLALNQINEFSNNILNGGSKLENLFTKLNRNIDFEWNSSFLITAFSSNSRFICLASCSRNYQCFYAVFRQKFCYIFKKDLNLYVIFDSPNSDSIIYKKKFKNSLINYWNFNQNVNDRIGNAHLFNSYNAFLTEDRFGNANSSLRLVNGYYQVPSGIYFSGNQLSILVWVKVRSIQYFSRVIDFGNGYPNDNVALCLSFQSGGKPYFVIAKGLDYADYLSETTLPLNEWHHLALVLSSPNYSFYMDGKPIDQGSNNFIGNINYVNRTLNYIGKSNWPSDSYADADFDDLKFFNISLSQQDVEYEMNNSF